MESQITRHNNKTRLFNNKCQSFFSFIHYVNFDIRFTLNKMALDEQLTQ